MGMSQLVEVTMVDFDRGLFNWHGCYSAGAVVLLKGGSC